MFTVVVNNISYCIVDLWFVEKWIFANKYYKRTIPGLLFSLSLSLFPSFLINHTARTWLDMKNRSVQQNPVLRIQNGFLETMTSSFVKRIFFSRNPSWILGTDLVELSWKSWNQESTESTTTSCFLLHLLFSIVVKNSKCAVRLNKLILIVSVHLPRHLSPNILSNYRTHGVIAEWQINGNSNFNARSGHAFIFLFIIFPFQSLSFDRKILMCSPTMQKHSTDFHDCRQKLFGPCWILRILRF